VPLCQKTPRARFCSCEGQLLEEGPENATFIRLAERIVQQQDAAVASPTAIRVSIPEQGRLLTFKRAVQVERFADLKLGIEASAVRAASSSIRLLILGGVFVVMGLLAWLSRSLRAGAQQARE
jgi:hypothetical protein